MATFQDAYRKYVPRNVGAWDWTASDFTHDSAWHTDGLDASSIVPAGAIAVDFLISVEATLADKYFALRKNSTDDVNSVLLRTQVNGIRTSQLNGIVACDSDRKFDYISSLTGVDGVTRRVLIAVVGWWIG